MNSMETEDKFLENIKKLLGPSKDPSNIKDLIEKIKENSLKRDNFNVLMGIIQKLMSIPLTNNGDKIWAKIQRYCDNIISTNEDEEATEEKANTTTTDELEKIIMLRDKEIKKVFY